jgi:hypothetical protein
MYEVSNLICLIRATKPGFFLQVISKYGHTLMQMSGSACDWLWACFAVGSCWLSSLHSPDHAHTSDWQECWGGKQVTARKPLAAVCSVPAQICAIAGNYNSLANSSTR